MKMGRWRRAGWLLAFGALVAVASAPAAAAQLNDQDCRCVDSDGNEIENCSCFRVPRFETLLRPFATARPRLGISVSPSQGGSLDAQGAEVTRVMEDGPADEAGIREDDLITRIDGQSLLEPLPGDAEDDFDLDDSIPVQRLLAIARGLEPGQEVEIEYLRDGASDVATVEAADLSRGAFTYVYPGFDADRLRDQIREYTVDIRDRAGVFRFDAPEAPDVRVFGRGDDWFGVSGFSLSRQGLEMIELTPGLGDYFGVSEGVLVTDVDEDSTLGLEAGDVILRVGDRVVTTPRRARRILGSYGDDEEITFRVQRDGAAIDVLGRWDD